ncbi:MAG TPA: glucose 1-dehydrogenase [Planctomycetota bacterium]|nr:glucose 1-dehydrogenase [Planctomycetota bacterium]
MRMSGRVALVTGAASGIGAAIAAVFAEEGAAVAVVDRDEAGAQAVCAAIRAADGCAVALRADVADEREVRAAIDATTAAFGGLDHLVCNAGVVAVAGIEESSVEDWDRVMAVNVRSVFLAAKHALPALSRSGDGTIVTLGSVSSLVAQGRTPAYVASKGAVLMLTKALALDLARHGIRCNCLCPGITDTPMFRHHVSRAADPEALLRSRRRRVPLNRFLTPRDCARAALYLSCADSSGITGTAHVVDAGYLAAAEWDVGEEGATPTTATRRSACGRER